MLPIVAVEITNRITDYKEVVIQIEDATGGRAFEGSLMMAQAHAPEEHPALDENQRQQLLIQYSQLRASIKARIEELEVFYDEHADDEKILFFEKLRLKLKKALQQKPTMNLVAPSPEADQVPGL